MIYLISYKLKNAISRDNSILNDTIKNLGVWWHYLDTTWLIHTNNHNASQIADIIHSNMQEGDRLFVVQIDGQQRNGWLPREAWEWIKRHEQTN